MDGKLVERLDRSRYRAVIWETAALLSIFVGTLKIYVAGGADMHLYGLTSWVPGAEPLIGAAVGHDIAKFHHAIFFVQLLPLLCLLWGGLKWGAVWWRARRDKELYEALYDELYQQHKYKYQRLTMWVFIVLLLATQVALFSPGHWELIDYPHVIVCEIILLVSLLTLKISWLIYNRR